MPFGGRELAAAISVAALILCCSCEKHRLGEDPEVQIEHLGEAKSDGERPVGEDQADKVDASESATPKPTPAQFFPESTPSP